MEISGLDITLRRIQQIEQTFSALSNTAMPKTDNDFQKILDTAAKTETPNYNNPLTEKIFSSSYNNTPKTSQNEEIDSLIDTYAAKNNMDSAFIKAVIKQESGFQPEATSHCGAMGLMQLMPATASSMGVRDAFDPEQNIMGGTKYLKGLLDRFDGNKELALAAYNAGPGAVQRYGGIPPYNETQNYVRSVLAHYNAYKGGAE